jgi:hypothetical protein
MAEDNDCGGRAGGEGKQTMIGRSFRSRMTSAALAGSLFFTQAAGAQKYGGVSTPATMNAKTNPYTGATPTNPYSSSATAAATTNPAPVPFKPEELEQIVAPIALYPDSLLAQVLMASTYPLEIVQADRWVKQNPSVKGDALAQALNKQTWDPSVKSLVDFPQVLAMMSEKLDWTMKLGDAVIADQKPVMEAVQRLRAKATASGNLKSTDQQKVVVNNNIATTTQPASQVIVIQSASPEVVYVPTYNPTVVYGGWPYPSYPPYSYYPPGYVAGTALVSFGVGVAVGAAWGHAWGGCNWNSGEVDVDINQNVNFNSNIDREKYQAERDARQTERDTRQTDRQGGRDTRQANRQGGGKSAFQHDPSHRKGVAYRDSATSAQYRGAGADQRAAQSRDAYRGRTDAGRTGTGGAGSFNSGQRGAGGAGSFNGGGAARSNAGGASASNRPSGGAAGTSGTRSSGFSGAGSSGSAARQQSSRGQSSRSSPSYSGSRSSGGGYSGGGARGGGGGARGGGGRGGGGRR